MVKYEVISPIETAMKIVWTPQDNVSLTAAGGANPSNTSDVIDVRGAKALVLTVINGNSTDLDVFVYSSPDGVNFDNEPYVSMNLGANKIKSIPITAGVNYLKVQVVNNDSANATTVTTKIVASR